MLGPLEIPATDLYRAFFVDLKSEVGQIKTWVPQASRILEIGCGEGAIIQRLAASYPGARVTGIDISDKTGRLFRGDRSCVEFVRTTAADYAVSHRGEFDLVLICDVLHHVPWDQHASILSDARSMMKPGGVFILKDWELIKNIGHRLCEFSDRVLTGDEVRFGQ